LQDLLRRAYEHKGAAFVEILQNCDVYNDGAWDRVTNRETKADNQPVLEHGKPLIFGKNRDRGIRLRQDMMLEVVTLGDGVDESSLLVHDETNPVMAHLLSRLFEPDFPTPIGVFQAMERMTHEEGIDTQIQTVKHQLGEGDLEVLLNRGETWVVKP